MAARRQNSTKLFHSDLRSIADIGFSQPDDGTSMIQHMTNKVLSPDDQRDLNAKFEAVDGHIIMDTLQGLEEFAIRLGQVTPSG